MATSIAPIAAPRAPVPPSARAIYCHQLVDAQSLVEQGPALARKVFGIKSGSPNDYFDVAPDGSAMEFGIGTSNARSSGSGVPASADEADRCARELIAAAEKGAGSAGIVGALRAQSLFPSELQLSYAAPTYDPETLEVVQWLCQYDLLVDSGLPQGSVIVKDAAIAVRIGANKALYRLSARWCPISASSLCSLIPPPDVRDLPWSAAAQQRAGYSSDGLETNAASSICYARDVEGRGWLLPSYVFAADPVQTFYAAARAY